MEVDCMQSFQSSELNQRRQTYNKCFDSVKMRVNVCERLMQCIARIWSRTPHAALAVVHVSRRMFKTCMI